ncbi:MAG: hypothetical protein HZC40_12035 [Chloroflexi bacterium]|nr:hypothetical protein [Chloroflexota bacterium]
MFPSSVLTGTLVSALGDQSSFALYYTVPTSGLLAATLGMLLILTLFIIANRLQMWAILYSIILAMFFVPFATTAYAPSVVVMCLIALVVVLVGRFFVKVLGWGT